MKLPMPRGSHQPPAQPDEEIYAEMLAGMPGYEPHPTGKERPITLPPHTIQHLLLGTPAEFRLVVEPQPHQSGREWFWNTDFDNQTLKEAQLGFLGAYAKLDDFATALRDFCPAGKAGDVVWLREKHLLSEPRPASPGTAPTIGQVSFFAPLTGTVQAYTYQQPLSFRPRYDTVREAARLPIYACRVVRKIMQVRVQRVQDITPLQIKLEGITGAFVYDLALKTDVWTPYPPDVARAVFIARWNAQHPTRPYESNPFVFVVSSLAAPAPATCRVAVQ